MYLLRVTGAGGYLLASRAKRWVIVVFAEGVSIYQPMASASGPQLKFQTKQDIFHLTPYLLSDFPPSVLSRSCDKSKPPFLPIMRVLEWSFLLSSDILSGALAPQLPLRWVWLHLENGRAGQMTVNSKPRRLAATVSQEGFLLHRL